MTFVRSWSTANLPRTFALLPLFTACKPPLMPQPPSYPLLERIQFPADLRALPPDRMIEPSGITACSDSTASRIVPYRTAVVPEARVAAMPPSVASAPGSSGKNSPCLLYTSDAADE